MEPQNGPPPPRGYLADQLSMMWSALKALLRGVLGTADDGAPGHGAGAGPAGVHTLYVDRGGRPRSPALDATQSSPPRAAVAPASPPAGHPHGALVGLAEGLERLVLPPAGGPSAKDAVALAHEELQAERVGDPFRRSLVAAQ
jgi:hypothetical protein